MADKFPMTPACHVRLKAELKHLKDVERQQVAKDIEVARGHGDLSENADYDAAKERQGMIEARIRELEAKTALAEVIDPTKLSGERVVFGATVTLEDADSGDEKVYSIVGEDESDAKKGRIAITAPVARALIGKSVGDTVNIRSPGGDREVEIIDVVFKAIE